MSTNKSRFAGRVVDLPEVKQRRRLENLLYTRTRVAQLAAEHRSHLSDEAEELYLLQLQIEQVLLDEFPAVFEEQVATWSDVEAAAEHHPASYSPDCSLCQTVARALNRVAVLPTAA